jgi:hypothetical protein
VARSGSAGPFRRAGAVLDRPFTKAGTYRIVCTPHDGMTLRPAGALRRRSAGREAGRGPSGPGLRPALRSLQPMRVVVDNTAGGDAGFADAVARGLRERGMEVELRPPPPATTFDTAVHLVSAGIVLRVDERPDRATMSVVEDVVRGALMHSASLRRRTRTVPVQLGETARVLAWLDVFG